MAKTSVSSVNLTGETLRQLLDYEPTTGAFTWRERPAVSAQEKVWNTRFAGKEAGRISVYGYREIAMGGKLYRAHRLAWLYVTGAWPKAQIDHIDGDTLNNRISNLREANIFQNSQNVRRKKRGECKLKGVTLYKPTGRYHASVCAYGKRYSLGYYDTPEEAHAAYCAGALKYHGQFSQFL